MLRIRSSARRCIRIREGLVIVTKVGARRGEDGSWIQEHGRQFLIDSVHDNLRNLGLDVLDIVNVRGTGMAAPEKGFDPRPAVEVIAELQRQGLVRHIGVSNVSASTSLTPKPSLR